MNDSVNGGSGDKPSDIGRDIQLKMAGITRQQGKRFAREVEGFGVTQSKWAVIVVVARRPGATQRLIAEALDISEAAAGKAIDRLRAEGLVERRPKEDDRRAHCIHLTEKAQPLLDRLGAIAAQLEREAFRGVAPADLERLNELLGAIYANVVR